MDNYEIDIYHLRSDNKFPDLMKFVLVYDYCTNDDGKGIALNQAAIGKYLNISKRNMARYFNAMKENGFVTVTDKVRFKRRTKKGKTWDSNVYRIDQEAINSYLIDIKEEDILADIEDSIKMYYDFLTYCHTEFVVNKANSDIENGLTEEEKSAIIKKAEQSVNRKVKREKKKMDELRKKYSKYLDILSDINEGTSITMKYLNENRKRLTNSLCATKNPEKHPDSPDSEKRIKMSQVYYSIFSWICKQFLQFFADIKKAVRSIAIQAKSLLFRFQIKKQ